MDGNTNKHPYFPRDLKLPHYKANITSIPELLGLFFGLVAIVNVVLLLWTRGRSPGTRVKVCWFVSCGLIHSVLEGYFSLFHKTLAGEDTYLAQMCEYNSLLLILKNPGDPFAFSIMSECGKKILAWS